MGPEGWNRAERRGHGERGPREPVESDWPSLESAEAAVRCRVVEGPQAPLGRRKLKVFLDEYDHRGAELDRLRAREDLAEVACPVGDPSCEGAAQLDPMGACHDACEAVPS